MFVKQFSIQDYSLPAMSTVVRIDNPSWEQIEEGIRRLNGDNISSCGLDISEEEYLAIGGGKDRFICQYFPDMYRLLDPRIKDRSQFMVLNVGGKGEYEEAECVPLDVVLQASRFFADTGTMDPSLLWEQYG